MRNIDLPEFGPLEDFVNLNSIVKQHEEKDLEWEENILEISSMIPGQVKKFMEPLIKSLAVLQHLNVKLVKYKEQEVEMKEVLSALMDHHKFMYANTCEYRFGKFSDYERNNPSVKPPDDQKRIDR
jgi:hypothetical protein